MKEITKQLKIINLISYRKAFEKWRVFTKDYLNIYNRSNSDLYCWARWMKVSQCLYNCTFSKGTFIKKKCSPNPHARSSNVVVHRLSI